MSHQNRNQDKKSSFNPNNFQSNWIKEKFTPQTISFAEEFGKHLVINRLTTSQIRNIYGEVMRITTKVESEGDFSGTSFKAFLLLRPKIAYAAQRAGTRGIQDFKKVMDKAHSAVLEVEDKTKAFFNFKDFFEAVLAYHKASGGRES